MQNRIVAFEATTFVCEYSNIRIQIWNYGGYYG